MKRAILLLMAAVLWTGCGFVENARVCKVVADTWGETVVEPCFDLAEAWPEAVGDAFGDYYLLCWPVSLPASAIAFAVPMTATVALAAPPFAAAAAVDEGIRLVEVAPAAWRDASGFFRWSGSRHNILIHRAALAPRVAAMPGA